MVDFIIFVHIMRFFLKIFALTLTLMLHLEAYCQIPTSLEQFLPLSRVKNGDLIFQKSAFNPAIHDESNDLCIQLRFQEEWLGLSNPPSEQNLSFHWNLPGSGHRLGMEAERWGNPQIRNQYIRLNYSYLFQIDEESSLSAGIHIDLASLKIDDKLLTNLNDPQDSYFLPDLQLGAAYNYRSLKFGISYGGLFNRNLEGRREDFLVKQQSLIASYSSKTRLGEVLALNSDILLMTDFSSIDYYLSTRFLYNELFSAGAFYNSIQTSKGLFLSVVLFEKLELGYQFYFNVINERLLGGHSLMLGMNL